MLAKLAVLASTLCAALMACSSFSEEDPAPDAGAEASVADAGAEDATPADAGADADAADAERAEADANYPGCLGAVDCERTVFVSSSLVAGGAINGIMGGDVLCTKLASASVNAKVRGRAFVAWLSSSGQPAGSRLVHGTKPYKLPNGTQLAATWGEFAFHMHDAPLNVDEQGMPSGDAELRVWTGTNEDGTAAGTNCGGWADPTTQSQIGSRSVTEKWSNQGNGDCSQPLHVFCVER